METSRLSIGVLLFLVLAPQGDWGYDLSRRAIFSGLCFETPPTLEMDFLQSCDRFSNNDTCMEAWSAFLSAFVGKSASSVQPELVSVCIASTIY